VAGSENIALRKQRGGGGKQSSAPDGFANMKAPKEFQEESKKKKNPVPEEGGGGYHAGMRKAPKNRIHAGSNG